MGNACGRKRQGSSLWAALSLCAAPLLSARLPARLFGRSPGPLAAWRRLGRKAGRRVRQKRIWDALGHFLHEAKGPDTPAGGTRRERGTGTERGTERRARARVPGATSEVPSWAGGWSSEVRGRRLAPSAVLEGGRLEGSAGAPSGAYS